MGLDMYLNKKIYIGANCKHCNVQGVIKLTEGKDNKPIDIKLERVSEITEQVGYWRKAVVSQFENFPVYQLLNKAL